MSFWRICDGMSIHVGYHAIWHHSFIFKPRFPVFLLAFLVVSLRPMEQSEAQVEQVDARHKMPESCHDKTVSHDCVIAKLTTEQRP